MPDLRWEITAELETLTPLRVGEGLTMIDRLPERDGSNPEVATFFLDEAGRPRLPGTTLKGWLRGYAETVLNDDACAALFGTAENGGCVRFFDGEHLADPPSADIEGGKGIYWSAARHTCVASHVVVDRHTRTAAENLLFFEEYVPAGTKFRLAFELRKPPDGMAGAFLGLLRDFASQHGGPAPLGAATVEDWGRIRVSVTRVAAISDEMARKWFTAGNAQLQSRSVDAAEVNRLIEESNATRKSVADRRFELEVDLMFDGAFCPNDPSRARQRGDTTSDEGNLTPMRQPGNKPWLPHSSFHGGLRFQAERIGRTLGYGIPAPGARQWSEAEIRIVHDASDLSGLDHVSILFGAPGWRSPLTIQRQEVLDPGSWETQELIAIDRFTGGGAESRKFKAAYFWKPKLRFRIGVDVAAVQRACEGRPGTEQQVWLLLGFVLRDLADGLIPLGAGAAKGFGLCTANVKLARGTTPDGMPQEVASVFRDGITGGGWPDRNTNVNDTPLTAAPRTPGDKFHNPYQFVTANAPDSASLPKLSERASAKLSHDRYYPRLKSGYIDCLITAETPLVIGASQQKRDGDSTIVQSYERDGRPAIPASTLRGLISAHLEALTNSSMRILENSYYSVRKDMEQALSAIGILLKRLGPNGKLCWYMKPLALPTFHPQAKQLNPLWRKYFTTPVLKQYIGSRKQIEDPAWISSHRNWRPGDPLASHAVPGALTWNGNDVEPLGIVHCAHEYRLSLEPGGANVDGMWRILGCTPGRQIPRNKEHELFIPAPWLTGYKVADATAATPDLIPVGDGVVERFERIAKQMTDEWRPADGNNVRPYEPVCTRSRMKPGARPEYLRLQAGDVLYFGFKTAHGGLEVDDVSFSAIWRKEVPKTTFQFFSQISPDLLPMSPERISKRDAKDVPITLAEKLFGFVEDRAKGQEKGGRSLAGRLRFTDATYRGGAGDDPYMSEYTLKILSSPKPPSPALYFTRPNDHRGEYIEKLRLGRDNNHVPRGRKFYVHHRDAGQGQPGRTQTPDNPDQKMTVRPLTPGAQFRFRIWFENLMDEELRQLIRALRPSPATRYKLGLGKPLGLGTVRLDPSECMAVIEPSCRYSQDLIGAALELHFDAPKIPQITDELPPGYGAIHNYCYRRVMYPQV
ncbi:MAG TPA: RAMP superfamily CRISPR-associated protein, partial [Bryobacteraceae bacterium]|nr:RAMP superfamily CRISPR-associated protein [Bryobacteraceae bacterium]